jgi:N-acetylglutamate synthase/N-acetylornithine aminotransferase
MTTEIKNNIMLTLHKISTQYGLTSEVPASFKKREEPLARLKTVSEEAWTVISEYINAILTSDRIENDKEKQTKKPEHWATESQAAKEAIETTDNALKAFCVANKIAL